MAQMGMFGSVVYDFWTSDFQKMKIQ
jgi:hypothetical protein